MREASSSWVSFKRFLKAFIAAFRTSGEGGAGCAAALAGCAAAGAGVAADGSGGLFGSSVMLGIRLELSRCAARARAAVRNASQSYSANFVTSAGADRRFDNSRAADAQQLGTIGHGAKKAKRGSDRNP
jgi:hypothetical protein